MEKSGAGTVLKQLSANVSGIVVEDAHPEPRRNSPETQKKFKDPSFKLA